MTHDFPEDPVIAEWASRHPQEWWALLELGDRDPLRERVLAAIVTGRDSDDAFEDLVRYREALENNLRVARMGTLAPPPDEGVRRPLDVSIVRMTKKRHDGRLFFRVDFSTKQGWSGYFDTTIPDVVEHVSKLRQRSQNLTVVGEVIARPYDFLVVLDGQVRIVR